MSPYRQVISSIQSVANPLRVVTIPETATKVKGYYVTNTEGQRSHVVANAISRVMERRGLGDDITEEVMQALDDIHLVSYQRKGVLPLLSVSGRVLVMVMEYPDMTMRDIAVRLGTVESNVSRSVTQLSKAGLISRTRVGRNNHYRINADVVIGHPDIWRLLSAVSGHLGSVVPSRRM